MQSTDTGVMLTWNQLVHNIVCGCVCVCVCVCVCDVTTQVALLTHVVHNAPTSNVILSRKEKQYIYLYSDT